MCRSSRPPESSQSQTTAFVAISATVTSGNVRVGTLSWSGSTLLADHERHERLLRVQAVLGLVPDGRLGAVDDRFLDLLAVVGREAVQDDCVRRGRAEELLVDSVAREVLEPPGTFVFLAHA